jgi:carbon-monoxide dehydrogenase medium subunit
MPVAELFRGPFTTSLVADELLVEVRLPARAEGSGWAFEEVARRRGDFAMVGVAVTLRVLGDGSIEDARLAYSSMGPTPKRAAAAEQWLVGQPAVDEAFATAARRAIDELEPGDDIHASRDYRIHVAQALTVRALRRASARAAQAPPSTA